MRYDHPPISAAPRKLRIAFARALLVSFWLDRLADAAAGDRARPSAGLGTAARGVVDDDARGTSVAAGPEGGGSGGVTTGGEDAGP